MNSKSFAAVHAVPVTRFIGYFDAVHFSTNFRPCWHEGLDDERHQMIKAGCSKPHLAATKDGRWTAIASQRTFSCCFG